jgi:hypothetical protein
MQLVFQNLPAIQTDSHTLQPTATHSYETERARRRINANALTKACRLRRRFADQRDAKAGRQTGIIALIVIGVDEYIGDDLIQIFASRSDDTLASLWRNTRRETTQPTDETTVIRSRARFELVEAQKQTKISQCFSYAMPRILLIRPSSSSMIGDSVFTFGHLNSTKPPPSGGKPRRTIFNSRPASMPKFASSGSVTVLIMSGEMSVALFVTPVSVIDSGALPNGARQINASRKYPTIRVAR